MQLHHRGAARRRLRLSTIPTPVLDCRVTPILGGIDTGRGAFMADENDIVRRLYRGSVEWPVDA